MHRRIFDIYDNFTGARKTDGSFLAKSRFSIFAETVEKNRIEEKKKGGKKSQRGGKKKRVRVKKEGRGLVDARYNRGLKMARGIASCSFSCSFACSLVPWECTR